MKDSENTICGIYCIENKITHKKYIGQTTSIYDRWRKHKCELNNNSHDNDYLQNAWNKYGEDMFSFTILEQCSFDELNDKERYYIDFYNTLDRDYGYNLKSGGQDNNTLSDYVKEKISNGNKKYYDENPDAKIMRSKMALKQWSDPNIKSKILGENNGMYGKTHTEEAKKKMSDANKGRVSKFRNTTPVICIELNKIFKCAVEACLELEIKKDYSTQILQVCRGDGYRKTVGGYHWKFLEEDNI